MTTMLTPLAPHRRRPSILSVFDDMFGELFENGGRNERRLTSPPMNVVESDTAFILEFELPGFAEKDIQVQVNGDQLTINAERKFESEKREGEYHRVEHRYGTFTRSLTLPRELDGDGVNATYRRGVLTVELPKAEPTLAKRIEVKGE